MKRRSLNLAILLVCLNGMLWSVAASAAIEPASQPARAGENAPETGVRPPPAPIHSQLDSELIRRGGESASPAVSTSVRPQSLELPRVAGALAIVVALIFLLRWAGKKLFVPGMAGKSTRAVQVLAKSSLSPRQHILLLRVGRRVIVVGDSGTQMNPLSEITDADEIASLLGQLQDEKVRLPARAFSALFNRARDEMGGEEEELSAAEQTEHEMSGQAGEESAVDPTISETREEISGLMDKIRMLSKHFRGGQA